MFVRKLMKINLIVNVAILAPLLLMMILPASISLAQGQGNGNNNGGGNGGGGGSNDGPSYEIIKLDTDDGAGGTLTGSARDINATRLIVGGVDASAAYWSVTEVDGNLQSNLHFLNDASFIYSSANGCNEWGEIVGSGGNFAEAGLYWSDNSAAPEELPAPHMFRGGTAINNNSVICGWSSNAGPAEQALAWSVTGGQWKYLELTPLGDPGLDEDGNPFPDHSAALAISDADSATGMITISGYSNGNAVIWMVTKQASGELLAGPAMILAPGRAKGVNNNGTVCGSVGGDGVVWVNGGTTELLPLDESKIWGSPHPAHPRDVNDNGVLVGDNAHAVMWPSKDSALIVLDKFLPKNRRRSPFQSLAIAHAVSESNEIVGAGSPDGSTLRLPFLAIPK